MDTNLNLYSLIYRRQVNQPISNQRNYILGWVNAYLFLWGGCKWGVSTQIGQSLFSCNRLFGGCLASNNRDPQNISKTFPDGVVLNFVGPKSLEMLDSLNSKAAKSFGRHSVLALWVVPRLWFLTKNAKIQVLRVLPFLLQSSFSPSEIDSQRSK